MSELHELLDKIKREKLNVWICVDDKSLKIAHDYDPDIPEIIEAICFNGTVVLMFKNGEFVNIIGGDTIQFMMNAPKDTETYSTVSWEESEFMKMRDRFKHKLDIPSKYGRAVSIVIQNIDDMEFIDNLLKGSKE